MGKDYVGMYQCYFCGEDIGILLNRRLKKSIPRKAGVLDMEPCNKCKEYMRQGILLISISDSTTNEEMKEPTPNPYRTGGWVVVKEEAAKEVFDGDALKFALNHRFMFITDEAWDMAGLEKGGQSGK